MKGKERRKIKMNVRKDDVSKKGRKIKEGKKEGRKEKISNED